LARAGGKAATVDRAALFVVSSFNNRVNEQGSGRFVSRIVVGRINRFSPVNASDPTEDHG
jgi:hypothetical protein